MRVLVVGGTGFIGWHTVQQLIEQGHEVAVFNRGKTDGGWGDRVQHIEGDRNELAQHRAEFEQFQADVVVHMMLVVEPHAQATIAAFKGLAKRIVAISSCDVYGSYGRLIGKEQTPIDNTPVTEDGPLRQNLYPYRGDTPRPADDPRRFLDDYDKIPIEQRLLAEPDLPATVLRLPMVYGPRDYQHRLFQYLKRMDDHRPYILLEERQAKWRTSRGYVGNVAHAIVQAATNDKAAGRIYNVAEPNFYQEAEWVRLLASITGWPGEVRIVGDGTLAGDTSIVDETHYENDLVIDTQRIRQELGYDEIVPQTEALQKTVEWERANPPATIDPALFDYEAEDALADR